MQNDRNASIKWDAGGRPVSAEFDDVYFARTDGLAESRYVFLDHNHLTDRWGALPATAGGTFTAAETGFGTGLNFLAAWDLWQKTAPPSWHLHFISVEKYPLTGADLKTALALWPQLQQLAGQLLAAYPAATTAGFHRRQFGPVTLTLIIDDALTGLGDLLASDHPLFERPFAPVDAWLLDGFAPAKNPAMWSPALLDLIGKLSAADTTVATFTAAGSVRRDLQQAGFKVEKVAGFGTKRDMLRARFTGRRHPDAARFATSAGNSPHSIPWPLIHRRDQARADDRHALVIGAGLAGCHSAFALAQRGWRVSLLEQHSSLASEASGNPQGVLYAKLSHTDDLFNEFNLSALLNAQAFYRPLWRAHTDIGQQCGVLQLAYNDRVERQHRALIERFGHYRRFVRQLDADAAGKLAGTTLTHPGLYFPEAGWLRPAVLCRQLVKHPNIEVVAASTVASLVRSGTHWTAGDDSGRELASAAVAVIATAHRAGRFPQTRYLPLRAIRGQVSYLPATPHSDGLATVLCGKGYLAPARDGQHCLGATFNLRDPSTDINPRDHRSNLENLAGIAPALSDTFAAYDPQTLAGRVGFRCATPDYLPAVGPVPQREDFVADYALLRQNARAGIPVAGRYWPGLYVNLGYGSRGLCYTPLGAQLLAGLITSQSLPVPRRLYLAVHPARFVIRDLIRNKI